MANSVGKTTSWTCYATAEGEKNLTQYISTCSWETQIYAYRPNGYTDPTLKFSILATEMTAYIASGYGTVPVFGDVDANFGHEGSIYAPDGSNRLGNVATGSTSYLDGPFSARTVMNSQTFGYTITNRDEPVSANGSTPTPDFLISSDNTLVVRTHTSINGVSSTNPKWNHTQKLKYYYPPYIDGSNPDKYVTDDKKLKDGNGNVVLSSNYKITKNGSSVQYSWTPNGTTGALGIHIYNDLVVNGNTYSDITSPHNVNAPNSYGVSYTAYVKRYYGNSSLGDFSGASVISNTLTRYTYSKPTLTGISLSKYTLSPRGGESLRVTLNGANNRNLSVENNFRTGIWSNIKGKYYIDETSTNSYRDLSLDNIKTMFPDTSASNGTINGTVYANRRNLGVSGGNPGNGNLVYETSTHSKNITIHYKPNEQIDPNREPSSDEGSSGIAFYKRENNVRGAKLTPGNTWVLPNNYDINTMTGVDVKIQYPKTDSSGVISGYKIELLLPNDGTHSNDFVWYTAYWYTESYTHTGTIPYSKLKRGISGNRIRITPFYVPSNVAKNDSNAGSFWYGPSTTKSFVDISWMLNDPVIDCPLTNTTWHNHKYRILFKLPKDNDTNYGGKNDIEIHYGSGKYRYQEIQLDINGVITTVANGAFSNARNTWVSVTDVSKANLTYLRPMTINPVLIPSYKDESIYRIRFRVRKAYGQNSNFDGWSNWSERVTINRKTVSNTNVSKGDTIMATHYMNVQTAFNNSVSCYKKTASDNKDFVKQESFDRSRGHNINGPHLAPPENTPLQTIKEYVSEFKDLHQLKNKINSYSTYDTDIDRNPVRLDSANNLLATFTPSQEFITAAKDQTGATSNVGNPASLKGRNYMKYMCDELNHLY